MKRAACVTGVLLLAACGGQGFVNESVTYAARPDYVRKVYADRCGACHKLPDVKAHANLEWAAVVRKMAAKKDSRISWAEQQQIIQYLEQVTYVGLPPQ
jgi:hypothetical protein